MNFNKNKFSDELGLIFAQTKVNGPFKLLNRLTSHTFT